MTHLNDHELRSLIDREASQASSERAHLHLETCRDCLRRFDQLEQRAHWVGSRFADLPDSSKVGPVPPEIAYQKLQRRTLSVPTREGWLARISFRPLYAGLAIVALLAALLAVPSVRAVAVDFLGLFRVQQIAVVEVNPQNLPEQLGSTNLFEDFLSTNVTVEMLGEPIIPAGLADAEEKAGFNVRLPGGGGPEVAAQDVRLQPGSVVTLFVDLASIQLILDELGYGDIELPEGLDGSEVVLTIQPSLVAAVGGCELNGMFDHEGEPRDLHIEDCMVFAQTPSPTIRAPEGLNLPEIGKAFLEVMGLSPAEAEEFSRTVDWTTTLVIPIPRYGASYETVFVDGVDGTLILQELDDHQPNFLLIWVKDGMVYSITGDGIGEEGIALANALN